MLAKIYFTQFDTARRWQKSKYGRWRGGKHGSNGRGGRTINYITFN